MKKLVSILLIAVVVLFVLLLAKDLIIKTSVEKGVEIVTGLKLKIGGLNVGIFKPAAAIKNLKLLNPAGFTDRTMIDMPEIYVRYDLPAIIGGKIHLPEVRLALREFVVVKNSKGELNLDALKSIQAQKEGKAPAKKAPAEKKAGKAPDLKIDKLALGIGRVIYKDYSKGATPDVKEFNINLNEVYTNIDDPYKLVSLIVVKALMGTPIAALTNFDLKGLKGTVGDVTAGAQKVATEAASKAGETATQAVDKMKGLLKSPFGSEK